MSTKSEIEVTGMNDDELVEGAKERQEFEGWASGETNWGGHMQKEANAETKRI